MANQIQYMMYEGFLADDPEMKFTPSGKPVTNFRMGSNRKFKNAEGEMVTETTWLKITAWNNLGETINNYCAKGSHVIVTGNLRPGKNGSPTTYQLSNGDWGASYEMTAREIRIIKGKDREVREDIAPLDDENIPF